MKKKIILFILLIFLTPGTAAGLKPQAKHQRRDETETGRKIGRAFIEMGINLAVSAVNYWHKYSKFIEDWQFTLTWKDQKRKFFTSEGLRLDSNNLRLNWTHAWSGALYYNWARSNRLSPFASFLFSSGGSLFWEYFAEWREISSINDHGLHLDRRPGHRRAPVPDRRPFPQPARPGQPHRLHPGQPAAGDQRSPGRQETGGRACPSWTGAISASASAASRAPLSPSDGASSHAALDLDLRLVTLPGYGRPGSGSGYSRRPIDNEYRIALSFNEQRHRGILRLHPLRPGRLVVEGCAPGCKRRVARLRVLARAGHGLGFFPEKADRPITTATSWG